MFLTLLFLICMFGIFGKLLVIAFQMAWGITKVVFTLIFLPLILIGLVVGGLIYVALPLLLIIGLISLIAGATN
ncbi:MAG: hypothetical protein K6F37_09225 [Lachnospiraceae bacterium]|nr:hypothetical protein [Lachnospiraceae bacterium]